MYTRGARYNAFFTDQSGFCAPGRQFNFPVDLNNKCEVFDDLRDAVFDDLRDEVFDDPCAVTPRSTVPVRG